MTQVVKAVRFFVVPEVIARHVPIHIPDTMLETVTDLHVWSPAPAKVRYPAFLEKTSDVQHH